MKCPRCEIPMAERTAGALRLQGCGTCGGVWLSAEDSARLAAQFPLEAVQLADAAAQATERRDHAPTLECPTCRVKLARSRFRATPAGFSPVPAGDRPRATELVELDVCAEHGTFFDGGELPRAARAIHVPRNNGPGQYLTLDPDPRSEERLDVGLGREGVAVEVGFELFSIALSGLLSSDDD
jgi:Zn-finger nucleic acid-binding protein